MTAFYGLSYSFEFKNAWLFIENCSTGYKLLTMLTLKCNNDALILINRRI